MRAGLLVLALCGAAVQAQIPQRPVFRLSTVVDGLPSATVTALATDRQGYLWAATFDGLARYDGTEFTVWQHDPHDAASLGGNLLQAMYIDAQDRIWVASSGLSMLDAQRKRFTHYRQAEHPQMLSEDVYAIGGIGDEVWFGTNGGGLYRIAVDGTLTRFDRESTAGALPSDAVQTLASDAQGRLWVGTSEGLAYVENGRVHQPTADARYAEGVLLLARVGNELWLGGGDGPRVLGANGQWRTPPWRAMFEGANQLTAVAPAGQGEYWLGTPTGLWLTQRTGVPQPVQDRDGLFANRYLLGFQQVPGDGLWVSVMGQGLAYLRPDWRRLAVVPPTKSMSVSAYCNVAPGAQRKLWQIDASGTLEQFDSRTGDLSVTTLRDPELKGLTATSGLQDSRGQVWLGHVPGHLVRFDMATGAHQRWKIERIKGQGMAPEALLEDARRDVWVGVSGMVQRRDGATGAVLDEIQRNPVTGDDLAFQQLRLGPDGEPWVASGGGLLRWDPKARALVPQPVFDGDDVSGFVPVGDRQLWLYRVGLLERWDLREGAWQRRQSISAGLPGIPTNGLQRDAQGRLWLATQRGLLRVEPDTGLVRNFGMRDGLSSQEFLEKCLYALGDGVLAATTSDGALVLVDAQLPDRAPNTPALLLQPPTVVRDGAVVPLPIDAVRLQAKDRELRVGMRLLSFDDPAGNRYRSRLSGLDPDWVAQGASGDRVLSALPPGKYTLALQGFDAGGNASRVHTVAFSVAPPWWRSAWGMAALLLAGVLLVLLCAWAYRERLRRRSAWNLAQHKRELAEQASLAKTHFLATLGHEVRTPMTGVLGMSELLLGTVLDERQRGYTSSIQKAGTHLLRLVNDALDLARIEAGRLELDAQDFDLRELLDGVVALVAPNAEQRGLAFSCTVADAVPQTLRGDPQRVRQILLNLLGNAVKFTEHGAVRLRVLPMAGEGVTLIVSDTGPGMNAEQQARLFQRFEQAEGARTAARYGGSGLGLAICQELAVAMDGTITVESTPGQGTRFLVSLPLPAVSGRVAPAAVMTPAGEVAPLSVLLVEDDSTIAEVVTGLLQARGHRVHAVPHGLAALTEAALQPFDIALLDLDLPGMDGLALATQLRNQGLTLPLLAVTARADAQAEPLARAAGFDGFLRKPVTGELLAEAMAAARAARQ
ncbi:ATP-binding protein [Pseudoxanthomonas sp. GM95]|uniref:sensor histidine kinase n=1 Tax=Pseudoxanthomonas sp. GM95 TaxID=1881043 RepID=UPI000B868BAB|nr:ATP-binding protein [Pseudoxanthomonas sp. GM95]